MSPLPRRIINQLLEFSALQSRLPSISTEVPTEAPEEVRTDAHHTAAGARAEITVLPSSDCVRMQHGSRIDRLTDCTVFHCPPSGQQLPHAQSSVSSVLGTTGPAACPPGASPGRAAGALCTIGVSSPAPAKGAPFTLTDVCERLVDMVGGKAVHRRVELVIAISPGLGGVLFRGDQFRLAQVLANVADNGVKYTEPGGECVMHVRRIKPPRQRQQRQGRKSSVESLGEGRGEGSGSGAGRRNGDSGEAADTGSAECADGSDEKARGKTSHRRYAIMHSTATYGSYRILSLLHNIFRRFPAPTLLSALLRSLFPLFTHQVTWIEILVADTGVGISEMAQPMLFRPFSQVKGAEQAGLKNAGIGLGLALTKAVVELLGGTIDLVSAEGQGTRITVRAPLIKGALERPDHHHRVFWFQCGGAPSPLLDRYLLLLSFQPQHGAALSLLLRRCQNAADEPGDDEAFGTWRKVPTTNAACPDAGEDAEEPLRTIVSVRNLALRKAMVSAIGAGATGADLPLPEAGAGEGAGLETEHAALLSADPAAAGERILDKIAPGAGPAILVVESKQLRRLKALGVAFPHPRVFVLVVVSFEEGDVAVAELAPLPALRRPLKPTAYVARVEELREQARDAAQQQAATYAAARQAQPLHAKAQQLLSSSAGQSQAAPSSSEPAVGVAPASAPDHSSASASVSASASASASASPLARSGVNVLVAEDNKLNAKARAAARFRIAFFFFHCCIPVRDLCEVHVSYCVRIIVRIVRVWCSCVIIEHLLRAA